MRLNFGSEQTWEAGIMIQDCPAGDDVGCRFGEIVIASPSKPNG